MNEVLVSVVVGVYNTAKYLPELFDGIIAQTYSNLEVILLDDGSTDGSEKICDEYATRDERFKVIHKKNEGTNYGRRDGVAATTGEYICILDCDDLIAPTYVEVLFDMINQTKSEISVISARDLFTNTPIEYDKYNPDKTETLGGFDNLFTNGNPYTIPIGCVLWNKMFKRSLFDDVDWDIANLYVTQDVMELMQVIYPAKQVCQNQTVQYLYRRRASSICNTVDDTEVEGYIEERKKHELIEGYIQTHLSPNFSKKRINSRYAQELGVLFRNEISFPIDRKTATKTVLREAKVKLLREYPDVFEQVNTNPEIVGNLRLSVRLFLSSPVLYKFYRNVTVKLGLTKVTAQIIDTQFAKNEQELSQKLTVNDDLYWE